MTNNYVLRRLRYTFNYNDQKMVDICAFGGLLVDTQLVNTWLKKDDDPAYVRCSDHEMAQFLNGFIIEKRGKKDDGSAPEAEYHLNNNIIFRKLKIALNLIDQDILDILESAEFLMGKAELTAFFRKQDHKHYRECQDQILRNFLQGLQKKHTNQSTAKKQSDFQALKGKSENKKESYKNKNKPGSKPFTKPKKESEKVVYKNPKFSQDKPEEAQKRQRPTISLKKDKTESKNTNNANQSIWQSNKD